MSACQSVNVRERAPLVHLVWLHRHIFEKLPDKLLRKLFLGKGLGGVDFVEGVGLDFGKMDEMEGQSLPPLHGLSMEAEVTKILVKAVHTVHVLVIVKHNTLFQLSVRFRRRGGQGQGQAQCQALSRRGQAHPEIDKHRYI